MSKARTLANLISDNAELADGQISVAEVVGAAPTANPTFTGNIGVAGNITNASGDLTLDVAGDITLDADGGDVRLADAGTQFARLSDGSEFTISAMGTDKDIKFAGNDGGVAVTALTLDMSDGGAAKFGHDIFINDNRVVRLGDDQDFRLYFDGSHGYVHNTTADSDILFKGNDGGSTITALTLDMSNAGAATFNSSIDSGNITSSGSINMNHDGAALYLGADIDMRVTHDGSNGTIRNDTGNLTLDVAGDIELNADGGDCLFKDGSVTLGSLQNDGNNNLIVMSNTNDKDIKFLGIDNSNTITALTLDMSEAGAATFNSSVTIPSDIIHADDTDTKLQFNAADSFRVITGNEERIKANNGEVIVNDNSVDMDFRVESNNNSNMLFVNGGNDRVGVGTAGPDAVMHVYGDFKTTYYRPLNSTTQTGSSHLNYWKLGRIYLIGERAAEIVLHGTKHGYGTGGNIVGKTTILLRGGTSATTLDGIFYSEGQTSVASPPEVRYVNVGNDSFDIYVKHSSYSSLSHTVTTGGNWTPSLSNTGSTSAPANSNSILPQRSLWLGNIEVLKQNQTETVINETSNDHDFRVESDNNTHALFVKGSDGVVGIGDSTPEHQLEVKRATGKLARFITQDDNNGATNPLSINYNASLRLDNQYSGAAPSAQGTKVAKIQLSTVTTSGYGAYGAIVLDANTGTGHDSGEMSFALGANSSNLMTERMRIDKSGSLLVGVTSANHLANANAVQLIQGDYGQAYVNHATGTSNGIYYINFTLGGSEIGSIKQANSTSVNYNTTSDYRLKENVEDISDSITRVKQLQPRRFNFITEPDITCDGFLAHEVSTVVPEAVSGEKDEVQVWGEREERPDGVSVGDNKLDEDGNTIIKPQGIDHSKLVPLLTAAIQELSAKNDALEARIATLEG